jgi:hypothetical protein
MTAFKTSVRIRRPIEDTFTFVSDPLNFPRWNSAVRAVWQTGGRQSHVGSTYTMERELPGGRVQNELEILTHEHPTEFAIRAMSGPTPFRYRYVLSGTNDETVVQLDAVVELEGAAGLLSPLAGRAVKRGVDDNFHELKRILETTPRPA